ncbi:reverse transcriptase domain-containing protein [Tanacetum coccineum]
MSLRLTLKLEAWLCRYATLHAIYNLGCKRIRSWSSLRTKDGKYFHPIYLASKTLNAAQHDYTVTEKELMDVILLLHEFDIEIKDKKGIENVVADHLSRIENDETSEDDEIDDNFSDETLMEISTKEIP